MVPTTVFIFTKPNRIGLSKTRLAHDIGGSEARRLNAMMTSRVLRGACDRSWTTYLSVAPDPALFDRQPLWPRHLTRIPQGTGDLGDRMMRAYRQAPLGKVIFLGTDMPELRKQDIRRTIKLLNTKSAVFGPADDGGFWLAGLKKSATSSVPFRNIRWSSEYTLSDVLENLKNETLACLDTRIDLDDGAALMAWRKMN